MNTQLFGSLLVFLLLSDLGLAQAPPDANGFHRFPRPDGPFFRPRGSWPPPPRFAAGRDQPWQEEEPTYGPVQSGFVILDGKDLEPPFDFTVKDQQIWLNDQAICPTDDLAAVGSDLPIAAWEGLGQTPLVANCRGVLACDGMLVIVSGQTPSILDSAEAVDALEILLASASSARKVRKLEKLASTGTLPVPWAAVVETFQASPTLAKRLDNAAFSLEVTTDRKRLARRMLLYTGLLLTIVALGALVLLRPVPGLATVGGVVSRTVLVCVVLLVLLNLYDLAATLLNCAPGGVTELNPIAREMLRKPLLVSCGKLAAVGIGCAAMWRYRYQRVTVMAAWWLGMAYTVLVFHWTVCQYILLV